MHWANSRRGNADHGCPHDARRAWLNSILRESLARLSDRGVKVLPPRSGAGKANLPDVAELVARCVRCLEAKESPLRDAAYWDRRSHADTGG